MNPKIISADENKMFVIDKSGIVCNIIHLNIDGQIFKRPVGDGVFVDELHTAMITDGFIAPRMENYGLKFPEMGKVILVEVINCRDAGDGFFRVDIQARMKKD